MKRLICLGGSITAANRLFCPDSLGEGYVSMLPHLLPDFQILNKGIDGFTIARILQNVDRDCINLHPDFVTIQVGINNIGLIMNTDRTPSQQTEMMAAYVKEYTELLSKITAHTNAGIVLVEPFVFPHPKEFINWIPHVKTLSGHIRELADIFGCEFLPMHQLLNQEARRLGYDTVTTDGIHLTPHGHRMLAQKLSKQLSIMQTDKITRPDDFS